MLYKDSCYCIREERVPFIPYLLKTWKGYLSIHYSLFNRPVVLSLYTIREKVASITLTLQSYSLPSSCLIIFVMRQAGTSHFPINQLRNQAIKLVKTSHYLVLDLDMFPSCILLFIILLFY